jgi:hypothetical protein
MTDPTLKDIDTMFSAFQDKAKTEDLNKAAWRIVKVAKDSKPFMDAIEGFMRATLGGVTLGGLQCGPVAMSVMIGWVLCQQFAEKQGIAPAEDQEVIDSYLRELENRANALEKPKGTEE